MNYYIYISLVIVALISCVIGIIVGDYSMGAMWAGKWHLARRFAVIGLIIVLVLALVFAYALDLVLAAPSTTHALSLPLIIGPEWVYTIPPLPTPAPTPGG